MEVIDTSKIRIDSKEEDLWGIKGLTRTKGYNGVHEFTEYTIPKGRTKNDGSGLRQIGLTLCNDGDDFWSIMVSKDLNSEAVLVTRSSTKHPGHYLVWGNKDRTKAETMLENVVKKLFENA